jgi:hypothetical protein
MDKEELLKQAKKEWDEATSTDVHGQLTFDSSRIKRARTDDAKDVSDGKTNFKVYVVLHKYEANVYEDGFNSNRQKIIGTFRSKAGAVQKIKEFVERRFPVADREEDDTTREFFEDGSYTHSCGGNTQNTTNKLTISTHTLED